MRFVVLALSLGFAEALGFVVLLGFVVALTVVCFVVAPRRGEVFAAAFFGRLGFIARSYTEPGLSRSTAKQNTEPSYGMTVSRMGLDVPSIICFKVQKFIPRMP